MNFVNDKAEVSKRDLEIRDQEINELKETIELYKQQDEYLQNLVNTLTQQNNELAKKLKEKDEEIEELSKEIEKMITAGFLNPEEEEYYKNYKSYHLKLHL